MELLIVVFVILGLGVMTFGIIGSLALGALGNAEQKQIEKAPELFADAGDSVVVTAGGKVREATIKAADQAGYLLESSAGDAGNSTMTFRRRPAGTGSAVDRFLASQD